ncbi:acyl-CoA carboxylase subunit beta [Myxococcota bacterium]|jgi:acetyl-CoA carboxylase carboxyltransferase component|nr:acyl-CoA carboxylase subunit beta [Myxococcota bacterium]
MIRPLPTRVDRHGERFRQNLAANTSAVAQLREALALARAGGGEKYNARHKERGKLLPRERVELLLDRDAPFLEICALAGHGIGAGVKAGASIVGGVGVVAGVECMIACTEATVKGGAMNEYSVMKSRRLAEISEENRLPAIHLIESAGADLPNQSRIFVPGGRAFRDITRASKAGIPNICLVFGSSTAGGAYIPGMSDYTVMVDQQARVFLAGPPLVKMATNEDADEESLGGAAMHSRTSGVSDYLAHDEYEAIRLGREIVSLLPGRKAGPAPCPSADVSPPLYDAEDLLGIVSADVKVPFDAREVIARLVDGSAFHEFKPEFGTTLVTGWAHVHGYPVGILANQGVLFSESAQKGAQFIQLCNQKSVPLLFLQNITGFMVGTQYEQGGIIKHGAKLINAVSNSTVPAITIMMGASFGAGNYGMCGRAYAPRFLFSWPNHRIAVMGGEQLAGVLEIVKRDAAAKSGQSVDEMELSMMKMMLAQQIDKESNAYFATARLWDDGIIDPRDTRDVVGLCLSATHNAPVEGTMAFGVFRH